jgi:hypothetical protein
VIRSEIGADTVEAAGASPGVQAAGPIGVRCGELSTGRWEGQVRRHTGLRSRDYRSPALDRWTCAGDCRHKWPDRRQ